MLRQENALGRRLGEPPVRGERVTRVPPFRQGDSDDSFFINGENDKKL
jgi:hypothetical protein